MGEHGSRIETPFSYAGAETINESISLPDASQLISVEVILSAASTTSEDFTVKTVSAGGVVVDEWTNDLSDSGAKSYMEQFDKRLAKGRRIDIDYPHTDANAIQLIVTHQLDPSVN